MLTCYHYVKLNDLSNVNDNFQALTDCDDMLMFNYAMLDTVNACTSIDDNFKGFDNACPSWEADVEAVNPEWLEQGQDLPSLHRRVRKSRSTLAEAWR